MRVFHDRLINDDDKQYFHTMLSELSTRLFAIQIEPTTFVQKPIIFGDFMKVGAPKNERLYEEITDMTKLRNVLLDYQEDYNLTNNKNTRLVFFMDAIEHIARIARIIRQDRGNALLVGVGGTGKQSLTRLASHICGYKCFQIELSRGYNYDSFHEDLKKLYEQAGPNNENTVFLFTDNQIVVEEFLEDVNNILNSGEVPNLFDKQDEYEKMIIGCRVSRLKVYIEFHPTGSACLFSPVRKRRASPKTIVMASTHSSSIVCETICIWYYACHLWVHRFELVVECFLHWSTAVRWIGSLNGHVKLFSPWHTPSTRSIHGPRAKSSWCKL